MLHPLYCIYQNSVYAARLDFLMLRDGHGDIPGCSKLGSEKGGYHRSPYHGHFMQFLWEQWWQPIRFLGHHFSYKHSANPERTATTLERFAWSMGSSRSAVHWWLWQESGYKGLSRGWDSQDHSTLHATQRHKHEVFVSLSISIG